jgi:hypothetical protein
VRKAEYPAVSCREPVSGDSGITYLCEIVVQHPGPCASFSVRRTVTARNAWEGTHPGWEKQVGSQDLLVDVPHFSGERARVGVPQEKEPEMPKFRRFRTSIDPMRYEDGDRYLIVEVEGTDRHPLNWTDGLTTREGAWRRARAQHCPVTLVPLEGEAQDLGVVFDPREFERAAYQGYVSHGISMTDGHYAPDTFEIWVANFRRGISKDKDEIIGFWERDGEVAMIHDRAWSGNDAYDEVKGALGVYAKAMKERGL